MTEESILNVNDDDLIEVLLFGNCKFGFERNLSTIKASINYIKNLRDLMNHFFEQKSIFRTIGFVLFMFWDFYTSFTMF